MSYLTGLGALAGAICISSTAMAATLEFKVTNTQSADGLFLTPFFLALHDGNYDTFNSGSAARAGVEDIAETGNVATQLAAAPANVATGVALNADGFGGAPVIDPGETARVQINVDPNSQNFLSFLSMVIPSNDAFIGNDNPMAYQLFDMGVFTGLTQINIYGGDVWDAGTEDNTNFGAAFNAAGGAETDTIGGVISPFGSLDLFLGQGTAAGTTIGSVPGSRDLLATIQIAPVPLPAGLPLLLVGLGGLGLMGRRRNA